MIYFLREKFSSYFPFLFMLGEVLVLFLVYLLASLMVDDFEAWNLHNAFNFSLSTLIWVVFSFFNENYQMDRAASRSEVFRKTLNHLVIYGFILSVALLFANRGYVKREFMIYWGGLFFIALPAYNLAVRIVLEKYRARGGNRKIAAIIGYDAYGFDLYDLFLRRPEYGIRCEDIFSIDKQVARRDGYPLVGGLEDFYRVDMDRFDFIYIDGDIDKALLNDLVEFSDKHDKQVKILPHFQAAYLKNYDIRNYDDIAIVDLNRIPLDHLFNRLLKRGFDLVFSAAMIVFFLSWMYPLFALIIRWQSRGPVIYQQRREGERGRHFMCYKFRSMVLNEEGDQTWAKRNDPRLTRFGAFLRKTSLDEFPQFFNVLRGDMSIVGPRPHAILMNDTYRDRIEKFSLRHQAKPGVTGLSQARGLRGEIAAFHQINARVRLDRFYLKRWNFLLDLVIILQTVVLLIKGDEKAY